MNQSCSENGTLFDLREDGNILLGIAYSSLIAVGGTLNILLIIIVLRDKTMRTSPTYVVLVDLAISDVMSLTIAPFIHFYSNLVGVMTDAVCSVSTFIYHLTMDMNAYSVVTFSVLRYLLVGFPLFARRHVTAKRLVYVCFAKWIFCFASNTYLFAAVVYGHVETLDCSLQLCIIKTDFRVTIGCMTLFSYILPVLLITGFHVGKLVRFQTNVIQSETHGTQKKVSTRAVVAIIVAFIACYMPYTFIILTTYITPIKFSSHTLRTVMMFSKLAFVNSIFDPVLYFFLSKPRRLGCC